MMRGEVIIILNDQISRQIRYYRKQRKMTLADLAAKTDIDYTYLGRIERNEINITLSTLDKIISGLGMTASGFFNFLEVEEKRPELFELVQLIDESKERDKIINLINGILSLNKD